MPLNLGTSGIGSHPLNDAERVILDIFESGITYPYIPQLNSDEMTFQFHHKFPGLSLQNGVTVLDLTTPNFEERLREFKNLIKFKTLLFQPHGIAPDTKALEPISLFSELLQRASNQPAGMKCQMVGPITESASIKIHPGNAKLIRNPDFFELLIDFSAELAYWLSSYLVTIARSHNILRSNVILFLDEPLFPLAVESELSPVEAMDKIARVLRFIQCKKAIHICDNPTSVLDLILKYPLDLFSFDAVRYPLSLKNTDQETLFNYVMRGSGFVFGLTPNTPETLFGVENLPAIMTGELNPIDFLPSPDDLIQNLEATIRPLEQKSIPIQQLLAQSLISPACGFRNFNIPTPDAGELIVKQLLQIQEQAAQELRRTYELF